MRVWTKLRLSKTVCLRKFSFRSALCRPRTTVICFNCGSLYKGKVTQFRTFCFASEDQRRNLDLEPADRQKQSQTSWEPVIGLEIHAQIKSASKLFSGAGTQYGASPNTQVSLFDAAFPGTLPVLNQRCVQAAVRTAQALGCHINCVSKFDRKHYFYADMPAGYQITQQRHPLAVGGSLTYVYQCSITSFVERRSARLIQIQLEQDSGKSLHDLENGVSLIDLNRAGHGLMEIVTEPDFTSGDDAASFVKDLRDLLVAIGTCDGRMAEGSMRVDANVSVNRPGEPLGTRTEVKNINSTRNIRLAIDSEIERQIRVLEGGGVIENETRSYDAEDGQTIPMRDKEKLLDYRFFPEPNLPPLVIHCDHSTISPWSPSLSVILEKDEDFEKMLLPEQQRKRLEEKYGVPLIHSVVLVRQGLFDLFEILVNQHSCEVWATTAVLKTPYVAFLDDHKVDSEESPVSIEQLAELIHIFQREKISSSSLSLVLNELAVNSSISCQSVIEEKGLWIVDCDDVIFAAIDEVLAKNPQNVKSYKKGKTNQIKVFTNKVIKILDGKANTMRIQQLIKDRLDKRF
ncbi:glutamyl-tRNA(gln) amidotransferase subunit b, mitochondrial [Plakobranchus ocellatus]|uniref:Glutamyl-tRNA(Gln) amidotransferase subunit B, mitochondrial n=1 Tax=Plakobranchus ocellatus TaxID=259542 RepID=A0AAV4A7F8_9GAST|nr:glutamyl-tRNA(gln) amidotransferase subunit b, mitochondrial [Plakobranchus ocellatus]